MQVHEILKNSSLSLNPSDAVLLYLSLVLEQEGAEQVLHFLPESDYDEIKPHLDALLSVPLRDSRFFILDEIKNISHAKDYDGLADFDPSWIFHHLKDEKPATGALIASSLGNGQREGVRTNLEKKFKGLLPTEETLTQVDPEVSALVQDLFNKSLFQFSSPYAIERLNIFYLRNLSNADLMVLIEDLGLEMLSLAFQGVEEKFIVELVRKLDRKDAEKLFDKFSENSRANRSDIKSAQMEVLSLSRDFTSPRHLILEAGVLKLARALVGLPEVFVSMLQYKMPVRSGFQLERFTQDFNRANPPESVTSAIQNFILFRLKDLAKNGCVSKSVLNLIDEGTAIPPRMKAVKRPMAITPAAPLPAPKDATEIRGVRI